VHVIDTVLNPAEAFTADINPGTPVPTPDPTPTPEPEVPSIAELVVASTQNDPAQFTILLAAVQAADPLVLAALSDDDASLTVFAPTDAAFVKLLGQLGLTAEQVLSNQALVTEILLYHVVAGEFDAASLFARTAAGWPQTLIPTLLAPDKRLLLTNDAGVLIINKSTVIAANIMASNGIVHVIDTVLNPAEAFTADINPGTPVPTPDPTPTPEPEVPSIAELVVASTQNDPAQFTILLAAVQAADPLVLAALSDDDASLTVFAPTDAAFSRLLALLDITPEALLADTELVTEVLLYHVVAGEFDAAELVAAANGGFPGDLLPTLQGTKIEFTNDDGTLIVDASTVIAADIMASNGIVHVIDTVLLPSFNFGE
jgi:uncharacterized surface protein with fasciclin (FAS1) repeats